LIRHGRDGVIIVTPNALHLPVGLACAERRIPMLVEKPMPKPSRQRRFLIAAAARTKTPSWSAITAAQSGAPSRARHREGGRIGRLTAVAALWMLQKPDAYFDTAMAPASRWRTAC